MEIFKADIIECMKYSILGYTISDFRFQIEKMNWKLKNNHIRGQIKIIQHKYVRKILCNDSDMGREFKFTTVKIQRQFFDTVLLTAMKYEHQIYIKYDI